MAPQQVQHYIHMYITGSGVVNRGARGAQSPQFGGARGAQSPQFRGARGAQSPQFRGARGAINPPSFFMILLLYIRTWDVELVAPPCNTSC